MLEKNASTYDGARSRAHENAAMSTRPRSRVYLSDSPWIWLAPMLVILAVFALYPFFYNIWLSFHEFAPRRRALEYVGMENWETLFQDSRLWGALWVTLAYTGICLVIQLVLGMGIALVVIHGAELENLDQPVVVAIALLPKQHRTG